MVFPRCRGGSWGEPTNIRGRKFTGGGRREGGRWDSQEGTGGGTQE